MRKKNADKLKIILITQKKKIGKNWKKLEKIEQNLKKKIGIKYVRKIEQKKKIKAILVLACFMFKLNLGLKSGFFCTKIQIFHSLFWTKVTFLDQCEAKVLQFFFLVQKKSLGKSYYS